MYIYTCILYDYKFFGSWLINHCTHVHVELQYNYSIQLYIMATESYHITGLLYMYITCIVHMYIV